MAVPYGQNGYHSPALTHAAPHGHSSPIPQSASPANISQRGSPAQQSPLNPHVQPASPFPGHAQAYGHYPHAPPQSPYMRQHMPRPSRTMTQPMGYRYGEYGGYGGYDGYGAPAYHPPFGPTRHDSYGPPPQSRSQRNSFVGAPDMEHHDMQHGPPDMDEENFRPRPPTRSATGLPDLRQILQQHVEAVNQIDEEKERQYEIIRAKDATLNEEKKKHTEVVKSKDDLISRLTKQLDDASNRHVKDTNKFRMQIGNLEEKAKDLQEDIEEHAKGRKDAEVKIGALTDERDTLLSERVILAKAAAEEKERLEKEFADWRTDAEAKLEAEKARAAEEKARIEDEHAGWKTTTLEAHAAEIKKMTEEYDVKKAEYESKLCDQEAAFKAAEEKLIADHTAAMEAQKVELEGKIATLQAEFDRVKGELEAQLAATKSELQTTKTTLESTKIELDTTMTELGTTKGTLESASAELATTKTNLETTTATLTETTATLNTTKGELETTKGTLESTSAELTTTKADLATTKGTLESMSADLATTKETLETTKSDLDSTTTTLGETQTELESTKFTLDTTKAELETVNGTLGMTKSELESTQTELTSTKADLESAKATLATTQGDLDIIKATLATTTSELETTKTKLADETALHTSNREAWATEKTELNKSHEDAIAALERLKEEEKEALRSQHAQEKTTMTEEFETTKAQIIKDAEDAKVALLQSHSEEVESLKEKHKASLNEQTMGFMHLQEALNKRMTEDNDKLREEMEKNRKDWEMDKANFEQIVGEMKKVAENLDTEKGRLQKLADCFREVTDVKSKEDSYYEEAFARLTQQILELGEKHFQHLTVSPPWEILKKVPRELPDMVGDTVSARNLRAAWVSHTVSSLLTSRIFTPFLFALGPGKEELDASFGAISSKLREKSVRRESVWRQHTLLAAYTQKDAKATINLVAGSVADEIMTEIAPWADSTEDDDATLRAAVRRIVKLAAETWRYARLERELIVARLPPAEVISEEDFDAAFWPAQPFNTDPYPVSNMVSMFESTAPSSEQRRVLLRILPVIRREPVHVSLQFEAADEHDTGAVYSHGLALYSDAAPVRARAVEMRRASMHAPPVRAPPAAPANEAFAGGKQDGRRGDSGGSGETNGHANGNGVDGHRSVSDASEELRGIEEVEAVGEIEELEEGVQVRGVAERRHSVPVRTRAETPPSPRSRDVEDEVVVTGRIRVLRWSMMGARRRLRGCIRVGRRR
ncbi:hypothetical protein EJ06DRAFT_432786 [Trichodelitschia bisporula]|uniref:Uncharacterized protein n=1 Tax=Trichodelitschia bisporula TaxID=703511 RepID=A0A6G1HXD2_9PEZI|nr:hypothetical protein EJ06DRAFT_432786 [Trichodelitschia bisporula]